MKDPLESLVKPFHDYAFTILRLGLGILFLYQGFSKLQNIPGVVGFFTTLGIPMPEIMAPFVAVVELVGGILLLAGAFTRLASFFLADVLAVAFITAHLPNIMSGTNVGDQLKVIALLGATLALLIRGGGKASLDQMIFKKE